MKTRKKLIIVSAIFVFTAIASMGFNLKENKANAGGTRIVCKCTAFGKCRADGAESTCAQSEEGGNIDCSQYDSNCHIGVE